MPHTNNAALSWCALSAPSIRLFASCHGIRLAKETLGSSIVSATRGRAGFGEGTFSAFDCDTEENDKTCSRFEAANADADCRARRRKLRRFINSSYPFTTAMELSGFACRAGW